MNQQKSLIEKKWDYIVIGTGMGGGPIGLRLAQAGFSVLFIEKGQSPSKTDSFKGEFAELSMTACNETEVLKRSGRFNQKIYDATYKNIRKLLPFMGQGVGGSSALYGMVLERFQPIDFKSWPLSFESFQRFYEEAETLFAVRKNRSVHHPGLQKLYTELNSLGLNPYVLPLANTSDSSCGNCQSILCKNYCKNDSGKICIEPAVQLHNAGLLTECEVKRIESLENLKNQVTGVRVQYNGTQSIIQSKNIILAAGALASPLLLMNSGLGNQSDLVGRNLMRHYVDLYALKIDTHPENKNVKEIGLNDFYENSGLKLGTIQSFGRLPPVEVILCQLEVQIKDNLPQVISFLFHLVKPLMRLTLSRLTAGRLVMASIVEDTSQLENRVWSDNGKTYIHYKISPSDRAKIEFLRHKLKTLFKPFGLWFLAASEKNEMLAHVCGTCRMGTDPLKSVVDLENKVHGLSNLYIVDSSFFPSSGGTNPALTIAANSLRVAEILINREKRKGSILTST